MGRPKRLDLLFALLGSSADEPVNGRMLTRRLADAGLEASPGTLLTALLRLERSGHVVVRRAPSHAFSLTPLGEAAARDLGPGKPVDVVVLMVDLVGFVAFTEAHGDDAARHAATVLHDAAAVVLRDRSGRFVKSLGDGVLGTLPPGADAGEAVAAIARRCERPDGSRWSVRAAARDGRPIAHRGDLYGADVNLVARLCDAAGPNELVLAVGPGAARELVDVRGLADAVPVVRVPVP